jgi:hypothetical protein
MSYRLRWRAIARLRGWTAAEIRTAARVLRDPRFRGYVVRPMRVCRGARARLRAAVERARRLELYRDRIDNQWERFNGR